MNRRDEEYNNLVGQPEGKVPQRRSMRRYLRIRCARVRTKSILLKTDQQLIRSNMAVKRTKRMPGLQEADDP
jgi:hypothetical protein